MAGNREDAVGCAAPRPQTTAAIDAHRHGPFGEHPVIQDIDALTRRIGIPPGDPGDDSPHPCARGRLAIPQKPYAAFSSSSCEDSPEQMGTGMLPLEAIHHVAPKSGAADALEQI